MNAADGDAADGDVADVTVIGDLVARDRRSDATALRGPAPGRSYDYHRLCTDAWRTAHLLRHRGVHGANGDADGDASTVAIAADPVPEAVLTFLGTALLGATTRFVDVAGPGSTGADGNAAGDESHAPGRSHGSSPSHGPDGSHGTGAIDVAARALVVPVERVEAYTLPPGGQRVAYGGPPDDPSVVHFERDVWSENPTEPPDVVRPNAPALLTESTAYSHADLLDAARRVADDWALEPGDCVSVRASLRAPGTVVDGLLAPLLVRATALFPADGSVGDAAVSERETAAPGERTIAPDEAV